MRNKLAAILTTVLVGLLGTSHVVTAWHITNTCRDGAWVVGIPNESWANGTTATFDFNVGANQTAGKGQSVVAPSAATSVVVTFSNSEETLYANRPQGCVPPPTTTTTIPPTTTTAPPPTTQPPVVTIPPVTPLPPATEPPVVVVDVPPVPQPTASAASAPSALVLPETGPSGALIGFCLALGTLLILVGVSLYKTTQDRSGR